MPNTLAFLSVATLVSCGAAAQIGFVLAEPQVNNPFAGPCAFDSARNQPLMIGSNLSFGYVPHYFTGSQWTSEATYFPNGFGAFGGPFWIGYDRLRGTTVLLRFGQNGQERTLEWGGNPAAWMVSPNAPSGFPFHAATAPQQEWPLAFDTVRQRIVTVGSGAGISSLAVHEWNGQSWAQVATGFAPPAIGPTEIAFDETRGELLVISRASATSTSFWVFDGSAWTQRPPFPFGTDDRAEPTFDPISGHVICGANGGWQWDGATWQAAPQSGGRVRTKSTVFVPSHDLTIFLSGYQLEARRTPSASLTDFGLGCPGALGIPVLAATQPNIGDQLQFSLQNIPPLGLAWPYLFASFNRTSWQGLPLPYDLTQFGYPGCHMNISPDYSWAPGQQDAYISLPNYSWLLGVHVYLQGFALSLVGPGGANLSASLGKDCYIGVPH